MGGILLLSGAVLIGSAVWKFKDAGTTVRPDRAASALVIAGPYRITRNPMYLGMAFLYLGIAIGGQSVWALLLLPLVLTIVRRRAVGPEEAFLESASARTTSDTRQPSGAGCDNSGAYDAQ